MLKKIYAALKSLIGAERVYQVVLLEGVAHFHTWLAPRRYEDEERGLAFLAEDITCEQSQVEELVARLRARLAEA